MEIIDFILCVLSYIMVEMSLPKCFLYEIWIPSLVILLTFKIERDTNEAFSLFHSLFLDLLGYPAVLAYVDDDEIVSG